MSDNQPTDFRREDERLTTLSVWVASVVAAEWILIGIAFFFTTQQFMEVHADFDTELPNVTKLMFGIPRGAYLGFGAVVGALLLIKEFAIESKVTRLHLSFAMGLVGLGAVACYAFGLVLSLVELIRSISA